MLNFMPVVYFVFVFRNSRIAISKGKYYEYILIEFLNYKKYKKFLESKRAD